MQPPTQFADSAPDELTGQAPLGYVILKQGYESSDQPAAELRNWVGEQIGKIARPKAVIFGADLPKTHSGKIMRLLLTDIAVAIWATPQRSAFPT